VATPARDGIRAVVIKVALKYPMWGHRKIAWLARHEHAPDVCDATCLRILREAGLALPIDYVRERRDFADHARRDRLGAVRARNGDDAARPTADRRPHRSPTGEITPIFLVTDTGPCFMSLGFQRYIDSRPKLRHIRTRRRSPQANVVIERYHDAIEIEALWRDLPAGGVEMTVIGRRLPPALQPRPSAPDARRRTPDRALPRRPRRHAARRRQSHSANAPKECRTLVAFCASSHFCRSVAPGERRPNRTPGWPDHARPFLYGNRFS